MFKPPDEKDLSDTQMTPTQKVRALYSLQWHFYRNNYYKLLNIAMIQLGIISLLVIALVFIGVMGAPEPKFFARNAQNQIVKLHPLTSPQRTDDQVRQFVTDAMLASMNFTFDDYALRLQEAATYFTDAGFEEWVTALRRANLFQQLEEKNLLMRTNLTSVPQIDVENSRAYGNRFVWVVYVDVLRTLSDRAASVSTPYRYRVFVQQMPVTERASGLAIYSVREQRPGR